MTRLNIMRPPTCTRVGLASQPLIVALAEGGVQLARQRIAPEVVGEGRGPRCAQLRELGAPLGDQLVLIADGSSSSPCRTGVHLLHV